MAGSRRATGLDARAVLALLLCCALWGLNQVAIKAVLPEVPALVQLSIRSIVALALLLVWMRWRGIRFDWRDGTLWSGLLAGALFAVQFACIFVGLQHTTAARSTMFISTSPFVVALLLAWLVPAERLRPLQIAGLTIAFLGVAYAFAEPAAQSAAWPWLGDALVLLAALLWGLTTVVIRFSALRHAPAEKTLAYQLLAAAALPGGDRHLRQLPAVVLAVDALPATKVQAFVFLTPVFGTIAAAALLGDASAPSCWWACWPWHSG